MVVSTVVTLKVLDTCVVPYEVKNADGTVNRGNTYKVCCKMGNAPAEQIKFPADKVDEFQQIKIGEDNQFTFEFNTEIKPYIGQNGKAGVSSTAVPHITGLVPFRK